MTFNPTPEQLACIAAAKTGEHFKIQALAGSGKSSTLRLIAQDNPNKTYRYLAFNKAIVEEAKASFPANVKASTVHSLAFGSVGNRFAKRLNGPRVAPWQLAKLLRTQPWESTEGVYLDSEFVASKVMATIKRFCATSDLAPTTAHVPYIDGLDAPTIEGKRTWIHNADFAAHVGMYLERVWADLQSPQGQLPFDHAFYLKMYELSRPVLDCDGVLFDEAQDCTKVMQSIVANQLKTAQVISVGDSFQAIYEWAGAHNALETFPGESCYLTQSFRFGQDVADRANCVLDKLGAEVEVKGNPARNSTVGPIDQPDAILARTNAVVVRRAMELLKAGKRVAVVGGMNDVVAFAKGAHDLITTGFSKHADLRAFKSWEAVEAYVKNDENGSDVPDGEKKPWSAETLRLGYVSVTRAKHDLDCGTLAMAWPR